jgi:hypothetical protein
LGWLVVGGEVVLFVGFGVVLVVAGKAVTELRMGLSRKTGISVFAGLLGYVTYFVWVRAGFGAAKRRGMEFLLIRKLFVCSDMRGGHASHARLFE